jgi:hypothetical protein
MTQDDLGCRLLPAQHRSAEQPSATSANSLVQRAAQRHVVDPAVGWSPQWAQHGLLPSCTAAKDQLGATHQVQWLLMP